MKLLIRISAPRELQITIQVMSPIYMTKQCQYGAHIALIFFGSGISFFLRSARFYVIRLFRLFPQKISMLYDLTGMRHAPTSKRHEGNSITEDYQEK
jgi:hypothetical protein